MFLRIKTGRPCLGILAFVLLLMLSAIGFSEQILPPGKPRKIVPHVPSAGDADGDLDRLRSRRYRREKNEEKEHGKKFKPLKQQLESVNKNPGPLNFFMSANLIAPYLITTGNKRENYYADPSVFVNLYGKMSTTQEPNKMDVWFGFRLAPLSGAGIYENTSGRFGFTYFGPMIGLGKIDLAARKITRAAASRSQKEKPDKSYQSGFFWMSGLSLLSKNGYVEKGRKKPRDFDNQGITIDVPGLWTEISYVDIYYSKVSSNFTIGFQMGEGKIFTYLGFGFGFWY